MTHPKERPCPHCKKMTKWDSNPYRPFCSRRCKTIDLGNWASGSYRIPVKDDESDNVSEDQDEENKEEKDTY